MEIPESYRAATVHKDDADMIGSGKTVSEIATELTLSVKTVSTYRARVLEKMKMRTNAELTRYAVEQGLSD